LISATYIPAKTVSKLLVYKTIVTVILCSSLFRQSLCGSVHPEEGSDFDNVDFEAWDEG